MKEEEEMIYDGEVALNHHWSSRGFYGPLWSSSGKSASGGSETRQKRVESARLTLTRRDMGAPFLFKTFPQTGTLFLP